MPGFDIAESRFRIDYAKNAGEDNVIKALRVFGWDVAGSIGTPLKPKVVGHREDRATIAVGHTLDLGFVKRFSLKGLSDAIKEA